MIALRNNLPLVDFGDSRAVAFDRHWLTSNLARAARAAGYGKWWLSEHVSESVASYLQNDCDAMVVTSAEIQKAVQSVLQVIGYADVADHFLPSPPPLRISLADIAAEAGTGYELAFFELLRSRIRLAMGASTPAIELCDLAPCVKLLRSAKSWRRDCAGLQGEIVGFVRGEVGAHERAENIQLSLT